MSLMALWTRKSMLVGVLWGHRRSMGARDHGCGVAAYSPLQNHRPAAGNNISAVLQLSSAAYLDISVQNEK